MHSKQPCLYSLEALFKLTKTPACAHSASSAATPANDQQRESTHGPQFVISVDEQLSHEEINLSRRDMDTPPL